MVTRSVSLHGFSSPSAGLEVPLEMLAACHGRVEVQCGTLQRLVEHIRSAGVDQQAREAAAAVTRYFDVAAVHHHADEEDDLFPALEESMTGSDAVCIRKLTAALREDHQRLGLMWAALRASLQGLQSDPPVMPAEGEMDTQVHRFVNAYRDHIAREDRELLPMAARLLSEEQLARIGQAMRRRRGVA